MKPKTQQGGRPASGGGLKSAGNTIISASKKQEKKSGLLLMNDFHKSPGNGLWCVNLEKNKQNVENTGALVTDYQMPTIKQNMDIESEFDRKIINQLKFKVQDLTAKLQTAMTKCAEAEYRASRSESTKENYLELLEKKAEDAKESESKVESLENTIINLNEALSNARKEINRLQVENQAEGDKCRKYYEMYQNLMLDKERKESAMSAEISNLMLKVQMFNSEKENLVKMVRNQQLQNVSNENFANVQKLAEEKESALKATETQMSKLINENVELKRKVNNEEGLKTKLNEIIKKKKVKIAGLKEELKSYRDAIANYNNEVKWSQDLVAQRDNQIKVFKEKIKKLEEEVDKLTKQNQNLRAKKTPNNTGIGNTYEEEVVQQVKAKPFLFGPETNFVDK